MATYKDYVKGSESYQNTRKKLDEVSAAKPVYAGTYDRDKANAYNAIVNREKFSYNLNDDQFYQQFRDKYMQQGKLAMKDTMGQAAALTGGYGSSYGQAVGQQAYDASLQKLNDIVPELYSQAYGMYQDEGNRMVQNFELAGDLADDEYNKYRDQYGDWQNELGYWMQQEETEYNRGAADLDKAYEDAAIKANYGDFSGYSDLFGADRAAQMQKVWNAGNYDLAYNSGLITADEYKAMTGSYPPGYQTAATGTGRRTTKGSTGDDGDDGDDGVLTPEQLKMQYENRQKRQAIESQPTSTSKASNYYTVTGPIKHEYK